jgi:AcrR family transcriptional regulator
MENTILDMENNVPNTFSSVSEPELSHPSEKGTAEAGETQAVTDSARRSGTARRAVDRSLESRRAAAEDEVDRLISAAFRIIERTGHLEPKVSDILAEAGLSNQAFYRHFQGKHALLVAVLDDGIQSLADYLAARMAETKGPVEAVREWILGMAAQTQDPVGAAASRPFALARGRLAESFPAEVTESERRVTAPLRETLKQARDAGHMPCVVPEVEAEALYHLMMGWVEARLVEGRIPSAAEVAQLQAFILAGLARPKQTDSATDDQVDLRVDGASILRDTPNPNDPDATGEDI